MKIKIDGSRKEKIITYSIIGIVVVVAYLVLNNLNVIGSFVNSVVSILRPFIIGILLALVLNPVMKFIEVRLPAKIPSRPKRIISALLSVLLLIMAVIGFLQTLIPQLVSSVSSLVVNISEIGVASDGNITLILENYLNIPAEQSASVLSSIQQGLNNLSDLISGMALQVVSYSISVVVSIINLVMGIIIAQYILIDKEKFKLQIRKVCHSWLNRNQERDLEDVYHLIIRMFNSFLVGKTIDSIIIGIICFIILNIFNIHYALLISFIVGVTNYIPTFGPLIGAIPGFFILLIIDPIESLYFLIIILVIQQFDGNILGPYILGDSMGLPSIWVLFSIIVGGGFFGVFGMLLAVPTFAVLYSLGERRIEKRLAKKQVDIQL